MFQLSVLEKHRLKYAGSAFLATIICFLIVVVFEPLFLKTNYNTEFEILEISKPYRSESKIQTWKVDVKIQFEDKQIEKSISLKNLSSKLKESKGGLFLIDREIDKKPMDYFSIDNWYILSFCLLFVIYGGLILVAFYKAIFKSPDSSYFIKILKCKPELMVYMRLKKHDYSHEDVKNRLYYKLLLESRDHFLDLIAKNNLVLKAKDKIWIESLEDILLSKEDLFENNYDEYRVFYQDIFMRFENLAISYERKIALKNFLKGINK